MAGGEQSHGDEAVQPPGRFPADPGGRVEVGHPAGDVHRQAREFRVPGGRGPAREQAVPGGLCADPGRADDPEAGDGDLTALAGHQVPLFGAAVSALSASWASMSAASPPMVVVRGMSSSEIPVRS